MPEAVSRDAQGDVEMVDDAAGFGEKGQIAVSTDAALEFSRQTYADTDDARTSITIFPAADFFVIKNLSVGALVGVGYSKVGDTKSTQFVLGPRVGYNIEFSPLLSFWPKLGLAYRFSKIATEERQGNATVTTKFDNNAIALSLFAPIMLHPAPHFFAGFGPFLDTDLSGDNRATTWGLRLSIGGWV